MTKSEKDERARGAGKVAFWAHKESIERMLEAKHTVMATFRAHKKQVDIEYAQFRRYVNELIRRKPKEKSSAEPEPKIAEKELSTSEYLRTRPNKKDLLNG